MKLYNRIHNITIYKATKEKASPINEERKEEVFLG